MKSKSKRVISMLVVLFLCLSIFSINVQAASYPFVRFCSDENFENMIIEDTVTIGENYPIRMLWFAKYNNEGFDLTIYDSNGMAVANSSDTFTNIDTSRKLTVNWDTSYCSPGSYTVEVTAQFYSLYRWNEAPAKDHLFLTLVSPPSSQGSEDKITISKNPASITTKVKNNKITVSWKKIKKPKSLLSKVKSVQIQYSTNPSFQKAVTKSVKKNKTKIVLKLKNNKTYYIRVRYKGSNGVSKWSRAKKVKTK